MGKFFEQTNISSTSLVNGTRTVTSSATAIPATAANDRKALILRNNGANEVYLGDANVTTSSGFPLKPGEIIALDVSKEVVVYGITAATSENVRFMELV